MNDFKISVLAFEKLINQLSDEKFNSIVEKIDAKGISGPSVDDYFAKLNDSISAFFNEPETYTFNNNLLKPINNINSFERDENLIFTKYTNDDVYPPIQQSAEAVDKKPSYYTTGSNISTTEFFKEFLKTAGESKYTMAA